MESVSKKQTRIRGSRLIAGALVGTVLSIGAVAGSASADTAATATTPVADGKIVVVVEPASGVKVIRVIVSAKSGIRW